MNPRIQVLRCASRHVSALAASLRLTVGFLVVFGVAVFGLLACGGNPTPKLDQGVIVLGIDGMDPKFLERHWGDLPHLDRLRREGDFKPLETSIPPQSPVAWSSVITGMDPGGHGIFDFIHRDPRSRLPFSSMAETTKAGRTWVVGSYVIPLTSPTVQRRRGGTAFWQLFEGRQIPVRVIRMPANFPPVEAEVVSLSGMGTPDMEGTYGTFTFATDDPDEETHSVPGGRIVRVDARGNSILVPIQGPVNTFLKEKPHSTVTLEVHRDPSEPVARFDLGEERFILREGEWSGWLRASFPLLGPVKSASAIFRVYLKQLRPRFELYVTPLNIDPIAPELPISTPGSYSRELAQAVGPFYTQGMAEDTSALREGALDLPEFLQQTRFVQAENHAIFRHELNRFKGGLLFFYDSSVDQNAHMLWARHEDKLLEYYRAVDEIIGEAMKRLDDSGTLIVMSDHGFTRFDRAVNLNTILMQEGFLALKRGAEPSERELFADVDWSKTQAYAMGLNSIYLNRLGREQGGIVAEGQDADSVVAEIIERLPTFRDPDTGEPVIDEVYVPEGIFEGYRFEFAPDLIVGYRPPYRASWKTPLGAVPGVSVIDNEDAWIGDHCVAPKFVPGVLLSNRKIVVEDPKLYDVTTTILDAFGVEPDEEMIGRPLF